MIAPPVVLRLATSAQYAMLMWVLLALFFGRVVGQILAATSAPPWLPPMPRWYSGLMPYRYLLPTQLVFLVVMTAMSLQVSRGSASSLGVSGWLVWVSYVYALGMVVRLVRYVVTAPERRGVLIPIVFHFVLAAFLFAYGSAGLSSTGRLRTSPPAGSVS